MLSFHREIHAEASARDSLHILARGLGMHQAACELILETVSADSLLLALNLSRALATSLVYPTLAARSPPAAAPLLLPRILSADYPARDRAAVYASAGLIVVTPAVLVHDLLHGSLPAARVRGLVVFAADAVKERSNHHFALSLFRRRNRTAFVKAFSEAPVPLAAGFHPVEKLMARLYVSRLCLWPRFHAAVRPPLSARPPDLVDLSVPNSPRTAALLAAFHAVVDAVLTDVKHATHAIDYAEIYRPPPAPDAPPAKPVLVSNFDDVVRRQLDGTAARSPRVRGLLSDLATLRRLLRDLFELNPVAFYQRIVTVRATVTHGANWLVRKEAQRAVLLSRARVWQNHKDADTTRPVPTLEIPPKWTALRHVLSEIRDDVRAAGPNADVGRVLVLARDQRTLDELRDVLRHGGDAVLARQFQDVFPSVAAKAREGAGMHQVTMTQIVLPQEERRPLVGNASETEERRRWPSKKRKRPRPERHLDEAREEFAAVFREVKSEKSTEIEVMLWCVEWVDLQGRGHRILDEYRPSFVVLYNADLALVRQVEVYKAAQPGRPVRLYILAYEDAVEEDRFRHASEREKGAFKALIRERATMAIYENQEGRLPEEEEFTQSLIDTVDATRAYGRRGLGADFDSRLANVQTAPKSGGEGGKVLVDTRELRSSLPMLLYQSSLKIIPLTLEVGDFILSKNIGIERKSVPDLYGSFGSGRLFNQAEALCRHYKYPCLFIELDSNRSMSLTATAGGVPSELVATSITSKMVLLMQQFPTLRLLWAKGAHDAAELFAALKTNEEEPDVAAASSLGVDTVEKEDREYNAAPKALLRSLPGIDSQNISNVMRNVTSVADLVTMAKGEMAKLLGSAGKGSALYDFVNEQPGEALAAM